MGSTYARDLSIKNANVEGACITSYCAQKAYTGGVFYVVLMSKNAYTRVAFNEYACIENYNTKSASTKNTYIKSAYTGDCFIVAINTKADANSSSICMNVADMEVYILELFILEMFLQMQFLLKVFILAKLMLMWIVLIPSNTHKYTCNLFKSWKQKVLDSKFI